MNRQIVCVVVFLLCACSSVRTLQTSESCTFVFRYTGQSIETLKTDVSAKLSDFNQLLDNTITQILRCRGQKTPTCSKQQWYKLSIQNTGLGDFQSYCDKAKQVLEDSKKVRTVGKDTKYMHMRPRAITINDAAWDDQWHFQPAQTPSMRVKDVWDAGFNGSGVVIAIVDDGVEYVHSDLAGNYMAGLSYDVVGGDSNAAPENYDSHGTSCAGIALAAKNTDCVIGVAYEAGLAAVRLLSSTGFSLSQAATALTHELDNVDISSNSWGPTDDGRSFFEPSPLEEAAFETGITQGRGGLGTIYTWAAGNGGWYYDDCNADGYAKSIYTIAVGALSENLGPTWYQESCAATLITVYSGDDPNEQITTTAVNDTCVHTFSGTSAACPLAAGIIAQVLQANPGVTWRDVQHIIVENAISTGLNVNLTFTTNAAGKSFHRFVGFGLMDAKAMVDDALTWSNVPAKTTCVFPEVGVNASSFHTTIFATQVISECFITSLEHVQMDIHYAGSYRGAIWFELFAPSGTQSTIFSPRFYDNGTLSDDITTQFMSVHFWGEDPNGNWTLGLLDYSFNSDATMRLYSWSLTFHGTVTDPLAGTPAAGSVGSACSHSDDCSSVTDGGCLYDGRICITCTGLYRIIDGFCVKDGYTDGYCDDNTTCVFADDTCVNGICGDVQDAEESEDDGVSAGVIAGAVVGSVAAVGLVGAGAFVAKKFFLANATVAPSGPPGGAPGGVPSQGPVSQPEATHFDPNSSAATQQQQPQQQSY